MRVCARAGGKAYACQFSGSFLRGIDFSQNDDNITATEHAQLITSPVTSYGIPLRDFLFMSKLDKLHSVLTCLFPESTPSENYHICFNKYLRYFALID